MARGLGLIPMSFLFQRIPLLKASVVSPSLGKDLELWGCWHLMQASPVFLFGILIFAKRGTALEAAGRHVTVCYIVQSPGALTLNSVVRTTTSAGAFQSSSQFTIQSQALPLTDTTVPEERLHRGMERCMPCFQLQVAQDSPAFPTFLRTTSSLLDQSCSPDH